MDEQCPNIIFISYNFATVTFLLDWDSIASLSHDKSLLGLVKGSFRESRQTDLRRCFFEELLRVVKS